VHNRCISKGSKIWKPVIVKVIFDIQLHGILAIKGSAGVTETPQKVEVASGETETRQKVEILPKASGK
jgi:hypothetical protein